MVLDSIFISLLSLFTFISIKIKVAEYYFELRCPQYVEVQLTFIINCNKPAFSLKIGIFQRFPHVPMSIKWRRMPIIGFTYLCFSPRTCPTIVNYFRLISKSSKFDCSNIPFRVKNPGF